MYPLPNVGRPLALFARAPSGACLKVLVNLDNRLVLPVTCKVSVVDAENISCFDGLKL